MNRGSCIIIGSGLGGLACGVILAKNGYDVTILEQAAQVGGCLQCFTRRGVKFETGMHFIGSVDDGQVLARMLNYLGIRDELALSSLDRDGYDVVSLCGDQFKFPMGRERFIEQFSSYFPSQTDNIVNYYDLVKKVASASSLHSLKYGESDMAINTEYQLRSIDDVIEKLIDDPVLQNVLVGNLPLYAAVKGKTPFSSHAFIVDFYNQSACRVVGGSDAISRALVKKLEEHGGKVITRCKVKRILCDASRATGVETEQGQCLAADYVVADIHPARLLEMLDTKLIRPAFRRRIATLPNTVGGFSIYLHFKENTVPYMNSNFYSYRGNTPWGCEEYDKSTWPKGYLYMHFCHTDNPVYALGGVILSYMRMEELAPWFETTVGRRGTDYEEFKRVRAEILLSAVERDFPGLRNNIAHYYTSTPLTYRDYTGTEGGSMYGVAKDITMGASCRVSHKTRVPNLFMTGQNVNSHGMLGVLVGAIVTCSEFIGNSEIYKQLSQADNG